MEAQTLTARKKDNDLIEKDRESLLKVKNELRSTEDVHRGVLQDLKVQVDGLSMQINRMDETKRATEDKLRQAEEQNREMAQFIRSL